MPQRGKRWCFAADTARACVGSVWVLLQARAGDLNSAKMHYALTIGIENISATIHDVIRGYYWHVRACMHAC